MKSGVEATNATTLTTWATRSRSPTIDFDRGDRVQRTLLGTRDGLLHADLAADLAGHQQLTVLHRQLARGEPRSRYTTAGT